ncbi:MAG: hydrogenase maturation protease [Gammaproteobacteria bacterium]
MLTIIGCGNLNRCDDGVGVVVAQRLQVALADSPVPGVRVVDSGTGGMEVMFEARGSAALIIVDACSSGAEPGAVFRVPGEELEDVPVPGYNLHDFRWQHALYAGRQIFRETFPADVEVYLIEAQRLDLGVELTPEVERAAVRVFESIQARVRGAAHG